jgi:serine/threonine-protein kinase
LDQQTSMIGRTIAGRYRIEQVVGQGGMATVYRARDLLLNRTVAVKRLNSPAGDSPGIPPGFLDEARSMAALVHPGIVTLLDALEVDGNGYLIAEFVEGRELRDMVSVGPLPPAQALQIAGDLAEALDFAHRRGIVHGDIKPENVMVTPNGRPKLLDFGIARRVTGAESPSAPRFGTPAYAAPEVRAGAAPREAGDIYGTGLLLFEMLTGHPPVAPSALHSELRTWKSEAAGPGVRDGGLAADLAGIIERATAPAPADRYPSAAALASALRSAVRPPLPAHPTTVLPLSAPQPRESAPPRRRGFGTIGPYIVPTLAGFLIGAALIVAFALSRAANSAAGGAPQTVAGEPAVMPIATPSPTVTSSPTPARTATPAPTRTPTPTPTPVRIIPIFPLPPTRVAPTPANRGNQREATPPGRGNSGRGGDDDDD